MREKNLKNVKHAKKIYSELKKEKEQDYLLIDSIQIAIEYFGKTREFYDF